MGCCKTFNNLQRRIKKAKKKVTMLKASTAEMRKEITQLINLVEKYHDEIVKTRKEIHPHVIAAESSNAELIQFISAWLDQNNGN